MFNHPQFPLHGFSFRGESTPVVERDTALALRQAFEDLQLAQTLLAQAQENIPSYTGQWNHADYVTNEMQTVVAASHAFEDALVASVLARMPRGQN